MKRKIILLVLLFITGFFVSTKAQVQIGTGTNVPTYTLYAPAYIYGGSSTNQSSAANTVYTQAELQAVGITTGSIITKVAFNKTNNAATASNGATFRIYMNNSSVAPPLATTTTWASILASYTLVYENLAQTFSSTIGWVEFSITPFVYTGGSLEIAYHWWAGSGTKPPTPFKWEYTDGYATSIVGNVSTTTSPPATLSATTTSYKQRPNIQIWYTMPNQPMVYDSSTTIQPVTTPIVGIQNQQVIVALKVNATGNLTPYDITSITFNTNGTTNAANIAKAQLFYTNSATFSNAVQLGSDILNPSGPFTFNLTTNNTLASGSNYYWITYDVASGTPDGNILDAECTTFTLSTLGSKTPTVTNPGSGRVVRFPLSGTKTINPALPSSATNYQSFNEAVTALAAVGVDAGGVTFNVANGTYTEQVNIPQAAGVSVSNPIVFQSQSGNPDDVILQATPTSSANYVLQFDGADYTTFKNMTIQLTGTIGSYACVISGIGMSEYLTLYGNKIYGYTGTTTGTAYAAIWFQSGTTNMSNNTTIQNNLIQYGSYGLYFYGGSSTVLETGNKISNNTLTDFYNYGIYSYGQDAIRIENNTVTGRGAYTTEYGIYMSYNDNASIVSKNKIYIRGTSSTYGLYLSYCDGLLGQELLASNNFVTNSASTGTSYGIYSYYGNYQKIYHNSVNITAGSATAGIGMYFYSPATGSYGNIEAKNNISVNTGGGYAIGIYTNAVTLGYVSSLDYNNYYATGTNIGIYGTAVTDLTSWKSTSGKDANSISVNPLYASSTDLHVAAVALNSSCPLLTEVPEDIDGDLRGAITDMGADEFSVFNNDINVKALYTLGQLPLTTGAPHYVKAYIENAGALTQTNVQVTLNITGANNFTNVYTIPALAVGTVDTIIFSGFSPATLGLNNVKVSVSNDDNNTNNELNYLQEITSNTFAYADTAAPYLNLGLGANSGYMLAKYKINGTKQIYTSKVFITNSSTIGNEVFGVVFDNNGNILDTSYHKIIASSDINTIVNFDFVHPSLTSTTDDNIYIGLGVVYKTASFYPLGCQPESPARKGAYYYSFGFSSFNPIEATAYGRFMIAAVVGDPANKDASMVEITSPSSGCGLNNQTISIKIKNEGSQPILASQNSLTASYKIDNGSVITENVTVDIPAQSIISYTFATQANLPALTADVNYLITTWTDLINDPLRVNDTIWKSVTSGYIPPSPIANNANVNYATSAVLTATPGSADTVVYWYYNINDTVPFYTGLNYTTPELYDTTTYYIASGGGKADLKITELAINKSGTGVTPTYPSWAPGVDLFEITNLGTASVNMLGYKFFIYGATNPMNYTFPSVEVKPGEIVILSSQTGTDDYAHRYFNMGGSTDIQSATVNGYVLKKPDNTVVDAVAVNSYVFAAGEASSADWSGNIPSTSGLAGPIRVVSDNNNASDWIVSSATNVQTICSLNPQLMIGSTTASCQSPKVPIKAMISNFPSNDVGVDTLLLPVASVSAGTTVPVKVKIKNYGADILNSVMIGWSINGIEETPYTWTGNLAHGAISGEITIANKLFTSTGVLSIKAWPYNPNGSVDNYAINDTSAGTIIVSMNGTYTIGSGGDFTTINDAVNVLNNVGVSGNVTFNIMPDTYNEKVLINQITGTGPTQTITFQSQNDDSTSVVISDSSLTTADNYTVRLNGTDYISFRKLTIRNKGVTYGRAVDMLSGTNFVTFANNVIESSPTGTASTTSGIYSASGIDSNILIENNVIRNGYYAIYLYGTSSTVKENNHIIRNNIITDFFYYGLDLYYQNNITVTGNYLKNRSTAAIHYGIYHNYNDNVTNTKNKIYLNGTGTCYGLYLYYNNQTTGNALVANNFITQSVGTGSVYALYNNTSKNVKYYHNSISVTKGSTSGYAFYNSGTTAGANVQLLNNIIANLGGGYAYYASANAGIDSSNYNCLFATGTNLAYWGAAKTNLAALQAASGRDAYSVSVNPYFVDSITDLHITNAFLNEKGTSVPEVSDDIDGQTRGSIPTIGADEFLTVRTLNLTVLLEGLYNGVNMNPAYGDFGEQWGVNIADKITVELHNSINTSIIEAAYTNQDLSTNGSCSVTVPYSLNDAYYIVIKHRNSITTWSAFPISFSNTIINYDFTTAASQAFYDNLVQVGAGKYAIYVGDVNQDGLVDGSDMSDTETENNNFTTGYVVTDVNGDGLVDGSDMSIVETANNNFVSEMIP